MSALGISNYMLYLSMYSCLQSDADLRFFSSLVSFWSLRPVISPKTSVMEPILFVNNLAILIFSSFFSLLFYGISFYSEMLLSNTSYSEFENEIPGLKTFYFSYSIRSSLSNESSGVMIDEYSKEDLTFDFDNSS